MGSKQQDFINQVAPFAMATMRESQVLASLTIAQACLESGYGESDLSSKANNFFGIKGEGDAGSVYYPTTEYVNGKEEEVKAAFAKFSTPKQCFDRRADLFKNGVSWDHGKYRNLIGEENFEKACHLIQLDGYATDPSYSTKLIEIGHMFNLTKYDAQVLHERSIPVDARMAFSDLVSWGLIESGSLPNPNKPMTQADVWNVVHAVINHLKVPAPEAPKAPETPENIHVVKSSETLSGIIGSDDPEKIKAICEKNGIKNPDLIFVGQKIEL